jgi:hypothetical protein
MEQWLTQITHTQWMTHAQWASLGIGGVGFAIAFAAQKWLINDADRYLGKYVRDAAPEDLMGQIKYDTSFMVLLLGLTNSLLAGILAVLVLHSG